MHTSSACKWSGALLVLCFALWAVLPAARPQDKGQKASEDKARLTPEECALLKDYRGKVPIPEELLRAYAAFVRTAKTYPTVERVEAHCLPWAIEVIDTRRPENRQQYGTNISLPFLTARFQAPILDAQKENADCYTLRTATSALSWLNTKSAGWKLYRYRDKPIE